MKLASKIELSAGVGTMVLALLSSAFYILAARSLEGNVLYVGLPMLVAIGAYSHVIRGRVAGLVILLLSGSTFTALGLLVGVVSYVRGSRLGVPDILAILPYVTAGVAVIAAVFATRRPRS